MVLFSKIINRIRRIFKPLLIETDPEKAYDLWASGYDAQPDNLMLVLDNEVFTGLLQNITLTNKILIDVGCGTGRHWQKLIDAGPESVTGYDVSTEMLAVLKKKFPEQKFFRLTGNQLAEPAHSADIIMSTLALAHIPDAKAALEEWVRVLKPGGDIIITDYHPDALAKGGNRTFKHGETLVAVKNYVHSIEQVTDIARQLDLSVLRISERRIDETVKSWYEKQQALAVYEKFKGVPIIYGIHLKKKDAVT